MRAPLVAATLLAACAPPPASVEPARVATPAAPSPAPRPAVAVAASVPAWSLRPKTLGMRTIIERPLIVHADGTSSLGAAKDVVRVSDHYSACFVTRAGEVACWGISGGGTWNGVATRDPDVGLHGVVDVAVNQTNACAVTADGAVHCWNKDGHPVKQALPGPAHELLVSVNGRACALLADGTIAASASWEDAPWARIQAAGGGVAHLLTCNRSLACGERASGGAVCVSTPTADDPRKGVEDAQQKVVAEIARVPVGMRLAMNDPGTAFCAYGPGEVRCFDGTSGTASSITEISGIAEVAVGWATLRGKTGDVACAKSGDNQVRCWDLTEAKPKLVRLRRGP